MRLHKKDCLYIDSLLRNIYKLMHCLQKLGLYGEPPPPPPEPPPEVPPQPGAALGLAGLAIATVAPEV